MLPQSLTIGIVQFKPEWGQVEENLSTTARLVSSARKRGAEAVVLPEVWPTGISRHIDFEKYSEPVPGRYTDFLSEMAIEHELHVIAGVPEREMGSRLYNTAVIVDNRGNIVGRHRKIHVYGRLGEEEIWTPGDEFTVVDTCIGRVGLLICYDGDFPESWRINMLMGAEIVFQVSAYESPCEGWWDRFYPSAALQNVLWAVICNMVGDVPGEKPIHLFGRSRIIGPDGKVEAEAPYVAPGERAESSVLVKKLELRKRFEEARAEYGNLLRDRRPELYSLLSTNVEHIESDRKVSR